MKNFIKNILIHIMQFFGKKFTKFCIKIPRIDVLAYILLYQHNAFTTLPIT
jgi:hypothetical protein